MTKLVIFDLDDTLISEYEYIQSGYKVVSNLIEEKYKINKKEVYSELLKIFDDNHKNVFNNFFEKNGIKYSNSDIELIVSEYRNHTPNISFFDDVIPFLKFLKSRDIHTGIISDGYKITQKKKIEAINANEIFDYIILTDELGKDFWKPNIKAFEIMKEKFNVRYEDIIYIGDNPQKDFVIKNKINIKTIRIMREKSIYKETEYINDIKEDIRVSSLMEIEKYILNGEMI